MNRWYVDSSLLGAYYCPEPLSEAAQKFLQSVDQPVISMLTEVEIFSLVAKKKRMREFGESKARKILMEFQSHIDGGYYRMIVPIAEHYQLARDMIGEFKTGLRSLDAMHLAIAGGDNLPVVTADDVLAKAAKRFGIKARLLQPTI
jgi:hypothetical protein